MSGHTEGQWQIEIMPDHEDVSQRRAYIGVGGYGNKVWSGKHICRITTWGGDYVHEPEAQANARLIIAAPGMLEAIKEIRRLVDQAPIPASGSPMGDLYDRIGEVASDAIDKALEGGAV